MTDASERRYTTQDVAAKLGMNHRFVLSFARSGALTVGADGLVSEDDLLDFARRRDEATQFVVEVRAASAQRTRRMIDSIAPISDEACLD